MDSNTMLAMLKVDLGITTNAYDQRLASMLTTAADAIEREGITLSGSIADGNMIIQYAAWLWKKRDSGEAMPRSLRWMMNNRLFSGKVNQND